MCLLCYETVTAVPPRRRGSKSTCTKPHKAITSQRIAHWIKDLLKAAGVDTKVFKAHSVRGASIISSYMAKGVTRSNILETADWSKESTFRRFYCRGVTRSNEYASKVLTEKAAW